MEGGAEAALVGCEEGGVNKLRGDCRQLHEVTLAEEGTGSQEAFLNLGFLEYVCVLMGMVCGEKGRADPMLAAAWLWCRLAGESGSGAPDGCCSLVGES